MRYLLFAIILFLSLFSRALAGQNSFELSDSMRTAKSLVRHGSIVTVAVIDTGIDANHPYLSSLLWAAPYPSARGIYGWDFVTNRSNPGDVHGHGTHVAGIIAAEAGPYVRIMALRYYSSDQASALSIQYTVKCIHFAIDNGAKIINYSGGGESFSQEEYDALKEANQKGILVVAAAGNQHKNTDHPDNRFYPAAYELYGLTNIISVASVNSDNQMVSSSNFGVIGIDLAAPGSNILSTSTGGGYVRMTGTSQATAIVSGVAALILSVNPAFTPAQVKAIILHSVYRYPSLITKVSSGGVLDPAAALKYMILKRKLLRISH